MAHLTYLGPAANHQASIDLGLVGLVAVLVLFGILIVTVLSAMTTNSSRHTPRDEVYKLVISLRGLSGARRLRELRAGVPRLPPTISAWGAARLLGDLEGAWRREGIELLAPKIRQPIDPEQATDLLDGLTGADRQRATAALYPGTHGFATHPR